MKTREFFFDLPPELVAQYPSERRGESRLMTVRRASGAFDHGTVSMLPDLLERGTLMVFNDSRVRRARLKGRVKGTGGAVEFLLLKPLEDGRWKVLTDRSRRQRPGKVYLFPEGLEAVAEGGESGDRVFRFSFPVTEDYLERNGHVPLPPYIRREDVAADSERYQTVYARKVGSSAAPTAGLHFTEELLGKLDARGIERRFVTLHVGLGTFLPVRTENIEDHRMHEEEFEIGRETAEDVNRAKREGRPVLAVGTTSLRVLESAWDGDGLRSGPGSTSVFIYPGYRFRCVDRLFTNFHTPESTLLMLVSAFAGKDLVFRAYREAVEKGYRFFSYGDAMLIV